MTHQDTICSASTLARLLKISTRRVRQLGALGIMHRVARGQYELFLSLEGYVKYLRRRKMSPMLNKNQQAYRQMMDRLDVIEETLKVNQP